MNKGEIVKRIIDSKPQGKRKVRRSKQMVGVLQDVRFENQELIEVDQVIQMPEKEFWERSWPGQGCCARYYDDCSGILNTVCFKSTFTNFVQKQEKK